jgi:hypothetical protein
MLKYQWVRNLVIVSACGFATAVHAGPFDQGKMSFSLIAGAGSAFNQNYTVIGAGIDYFVLDGLQLGLDAQAWMGGDRSIYKLSPQARYVLDIGDTIRPYIGVFYRKTYIQNFDNLSSVGERAGVYLQSNRKYSLSVGYVFEQYQNCDNTIFNDCTNSYPELVLSIAL